MIRGAFIVLGIILAGMAISEGEVLVAIEILFFFTLFGVVIQSAVSSSNKNEEKAAKRETTEPVISDSKTEKVEEVEKLSETIEPEKTIEETNEWKCPECGNINNSEFCEECGAKKPVIPVVKDRFCTKCGAKLEEGQKYCEDCGTKVE